ncbi:hypothetical protein BB561_000621 [Smittium simulii]|uniref:Sm domain-containing protein n=1 Tax=Smittium simulii TaxID=133385 RepID=A0A2T9YYB2_9FUNG|nr:hypothetical protein BB561_000621 [Smittium simulii]
MEQNNEQNGYKNDRQSSRGGGRGGGSRGGRGGGYRGRGGAGGNYNNDRKNEHQAKKPRTVAIDLSKYIDKKVNVRFEGGREVSGILKGYDQLQNMVLDETLELVQLQNEDGSSVEKTREVGLLVCRGPSVITISPLEGFEEIDNPFFEATE